MADNTVKVRLQSAYKTSADWDTLNPVLKNGEVGYVSSPASMYGWYKIGNGTSTWNQLPYSTYRPLNNGDFDTINVTDETAGDLIVTGAARFLNTIQGTASSASNAAKVAGTLTITQAGTTKLNAWNGSAATSIALTDNNTTYKFATSYSGVTSAIAGLKANGASTFDSTASLSDNNIVNPMLNSLTTGDAALGTTGYLITANAKATSPTTTWHRRQASLVSVGYATSAGAAPYPVVGVTASNYLTATTANKVINVKHDDTLSSTGSITAGTAGTADAWGESISFTIPEFNYNKGGHLTSASSKTFKVTIPSTSGLATTGYVNERVANAVHFKGGFDPSNADALKIPVKEIGDMYVATAAGTFYELDLESGDSIIFSSSVAANTNPASTSFIGVEKTVSVTNNNPTLAWNTVSTVGTVEGVNLTVKMPANPNTNTTYTIDNTTSGVTSAYVGLHANGATTWSSTANLATSAFVNPLINALTEGSSQASTADYIITSYVGAGTPTTTYHRRKASLVTVGKAEYATSAGAAPQDGHTYLTSSNFTSSAGAAAVALKIVTSGTSAATATCSVPAFTASLAGIVKPPSTTATNKFLRSDNTWATVDVDDKKATQTATTAKTYLIGNAGSATTTSGCNLSTAVYMNNGNLVVGGSITIGGNNADTSGAKWQYNSSLESVSLVFA